MFVARCMRGRGRRSWSVGRNSPDAARSGGDRDEAKLIGEMRKPTAAAHLVNLLAQADDSSLQELVELGASIRSAMAKGDDREVRSLLQGRAAAIATTMAQARKIARANGESVSGAVGDQIAQTLRAAMASDEAAAVVRGGTLTEALDEPGFGDFSIESAARAPQPRAPAVGLFSRKPKSPSTGRRRKKPSAPRAGADQVGRGRCEARREALAATTKRRDGFGRDRDRLASQLAQIDDQLTAAQAEVDDVEAQLRDATVELDAASGSPPG